LVVTRLMQIGILPDLAKTDLTCAQPFGRITCQERCTLRSNFFAMKGLET
jgi:hypothetical protein